MKIDVAIDGADEVTRDMQLVKGRGGALLREKMVRSTPNKNKQYSTSSLVQKLKVKTQIALHTQVEKQAKKFIVIVDESKLTPNGLGPTGAMPVEIVQFCYKFTLQNLAELTGAKVLITVILISNNPK